MRLDSASSTDTTKREFVKKAAYAVPAVLTLAAAPSFASAGSSSRKGKRPKTANHGGKRRREDKRGKGRDD
ncbi:MAG TPA: hypothetical protein VGD07_19635 [Methylomirabilota bacterium]|jgi:hypothetical protein